MTTSEVPEAGHGIAEDPPIACTLAEGDMQTRLDEWRALVDDAPRHPIPGGLRLWFPPPAPLAEIARLSGAEQACCAFFTFTITVDDRGVTLDVTAPTDGQTVLASIFGAAS